MRVFAATLLAISLSACHTTAPATHGNGEANTMQFVEDLFETFNTHNSQALAAFYTEDARVISPENCTPTIGRNAIAANYQALFDEIPDVYDALETVVIEGDKVALTFTASSKIEGRAFELPIAAFMTLEGGLISEDKVYFDTDMTPDCENQ